MLNVVLHLLVQPEVGVAVSHMATAGAVMAGLPVVPQIALAGVALATTWSIAR